MTAPTQATAMTPCAPTHTPEVDIDALRAKYLLERDKRVRPEGQQQYVEAADEFAGFYESDPHLPVEPREPITDDIEVVVLGGGFCGLIAAHRLQQAGVTDFKIVELGGDFGGVWYWNRYPGIQIDSDAYCYLPLLEETGYMPKERFSHGDECFEHAQRIGKHFGFYDNAIFHTLIRSLEWDEEINRWQIRTNRGDEIRARFVVMAQGPYNRPKLPGIPGITDFKGHTFHTARWDYDYTGGDLHGGLDKIADKRIAVIGTGSSGIQAIPHLAKAAPATWMPSTRVTRADWRELFTANLETMFFMSQMVASELKAQSRPGSIVSISSISGMNTAPFHIGYGSAKAALVAATRTMAVELAEVGIRVNAIAPGVTATPASSTYVDDDPERDRRAITMGRRGRPEEQAGAILFLLSDLSTYITGQTLLVDGGLNLKWTHMGPDHTSLFLKDESFRDAITH